MKKPARSASRPQPVAPVHLAGVVAGTFHPGGIQGDERDVIRVVPLVRDITAVTR